MKYNHIQYHVRDVAKNGSVRMNPVSLRIVLADKVPQVIIGVSHEEGTPYGFIAPAHFGENGQAGKNPWGVPFSDGEGIYGQQQIVRPKVKLPRALLEQLGL